MRISEKGQVTIPKNFRELAGLKPNSEIRILLEGGRVVIERKDVGEESAKAARIENFLRDLKKLEGSGDPSINADDVMRATRDRD
ncbi:MAG: AbrB/MazE/SpoVT family DNA-binding domain-containing protein [Nitratireductor sp.]|nr:AbrB/MazE/SpoVT family DNA-binding domain-containing protein [Nitratireductor sp.]